MIGIICFWSLRYNYVSLESERWA